MVDKLKAIQDLVYGLLLIVIIWFTFSHYDAFEWVLEYAESHEEYELDEFLLLMVILGFFSIIYSVRRIKEAKRINEQLMNLNNNLEKRVQAELEERYAQEQLLIQQSKMAAMGEMIGNIAHQWRQPLNALSLVLQNIKFSYENDQLNDQFMNKSMDKANTLTHTMSSTIDDFRNFFNPNKIYEKFNINDVIHKSIQIISAAYSSHNITIDFEEQEDFHVYGYKNELMQVLINILNNAKDAIIQDSTIEGLVNINIVSDNDTVTILIEDNGGGVPSEILDKVFEPYFTTKDKSVGTGIGLYMAKVMVENNMKGHISVTNNSKGAVFSLQLSTKNIQDKTI